MKKTVVFIFFSLLIGGNLVFSQEKPAYKNPALSVDARVQDLINRMTLEEKVGQLLCPLGWEMYDKKGGDVSHSAKFEETVKEKNIGMLWATFRADPWTQKTIENGLNPEMAAKAGNALQKYIIENTRLGIPIFLAEEAPHGHMAIGTTVFPTGIGQASAWNPDLLEQMAGAVGEELRLQGGHISYGPVLDLSRDHRWSRVEESYGEDPVLMGACAAAIVKGFGAGDLSREYSTVSTLKHFVAYGIPEGGHNGSAASVGERELREVFFPPFNAAIDAGALSVMSGYNSIDGIPCTSSHFLLTDVLRTEWGFRGFTVSDLGSIEGIRGSHRIAQNHRIAAELAVKAGLDVDLGGNAYVNLIESVKKGEVKEEVINIAVSRVLTLKFEMGLFENPYVNPEKAKKGVRTKDHVALARKTAQESVVLLENKNNLLPLGKNLKIAVIGPNADNVYNMLGDYTAPQEESNVVTVLEGIREKIGSQNALYAKGCYIRDTLNLNIEEAVANAKKSDVIVAVMGGSSARDFRTKYIETGAAVTSEEHISDMESGEGFDRATLDLLGKQMDLLKALKNTGKPLVVIYIQGRPLNMNWASENADALLTAWYPGQEGGSAIADILFGDYNPAGRLPISVARSVGQLPVHYNKRNPMGHNYVEVSSEPLYVFGYGKSYTDFEYGDLRLEKIADHTYSASVSVTNTGKYDGDEVVQLYVRNHFASVSQPNKQLRYFKRVHIKTGETKTLSFTLTESDFSIINAEMKRVVEPGSTFTIMVGNSSNSIKSEKVITAGS
ncbi:MAG: glycoside hydrolase family 3 C-terminal domain-containing protein [Tannerella sp.]|jgi:beta-glucosidase|nr:glycoside hydrolase family 3 C-terminal domain-containing protein [Tannerella sp.]